MKSFGGGLAQYREVSTKRRMPTEATETPTGIALKS